MTDKQEGTHAEAANSPDWTAIYQCSALDVAIRACENAGWPHNEAVGTLRTIRANIEAAPRTPGR